MADLCRVIDVNGVAGPATRSGSAAGKAAVAKVCIDPSTLEVSSAMVVHLSADEIQKIQRDYDTRIVRLHQPDRQDAARTGPILKDKTIEALKRAAQGEPDRTSKTSDKKK
jgi:hypothetical protein